MLQLVLWADDDGGFRMVLYCCTHHFAEGVDGRDESALSMVLSAEASNLDEMHRVGQAKLGALCVNCCRGCETEVCGEGNQLTSLL